MTLSFIEILESSGPKTEPWSTLEGGINYTSFIIISKVVLIIKTVYSNGHSSHVKQF